MQLRESPFDLGGAEERGVRVFETAIWQNSELCNECFTRVRDIGPEYSSVLRRTGDARLEVPDLELTTNEWFERTPDGRQEHAPGDANRRFGTCWCLNCGGDLSADHRDKPLDALLSLVEPLVAYVDEHTDHDLDRQEFEDELTELKRTPEFQSWETEMLAVAFARAVRVEVPA